MLALSVLMLILSCPVKKFLEINDNMPVSVEKGIKQKTGLAISARYNSNYCCFAKEMTVVEHENQFSSHSKPGKNFAEFAAQTGFDIHYFLSRSKSRISNAEYTLLSLPLFLEHRSLLI